ncbi:hypothetical protein FE257_004240 [Aspergillus nanangensis]|uniref:Uncharacterized protein n=1 Tax=Aspergillus nanangensis TaxID=2582783 RepID=A0AAD4CRJ2_ASPNN|nr:hypothetical protein FE257_004240 [Aspergillus nanangensis]
MPQPGKDELWLQALSNTLSVPTGLIRPPKLSSTYSTIRSEQGDKAANLLLAQKSATRKTGQSSTVVDEKQIKKKKWAYEDYCDVLTDIVGTGSGSIEVVQSVWDTLQAENPKKARTGSLKFRKKATDHDNDALMIDLVSAAIKHRQIKVLQLLVHVAGPQVRNATLPTALCTNSQDVVQVFMEEGADPNTSPEPFREIVAAGNVDLTRLLFRSRFPVSQDTATLALSTAVKCGNIETIHLLLSHGADSNVENGVALKYAIDSHRVDIVLLLLCNQPPSEAVLASMVSYTFSQHTISPDLRYQFIEVLLNGGATGKDVDVTLSAAVCQDQGRLVQLFMSKGARISGDNGVAYRHAIYTVDLETLRILNAGYLGISLATSIFGTISQPHQDGSSISFDDWRTIAKMLLDQGATGGVISEALIDRVAARDLESVQLLLAHGASADYRSGRALDLAVQSENLAYVEALLQKRPTLGTLNIVFPRTDALSRRVRVDIARKLLEAGATGEPVNRALNLAITVSSERDRSYIKTLVSGGADVFQGQGDLFLLATRDGDYETLKILLRGCISHSQLSACIPLAMELDGELRYSICDILLQNGARGATVSQALVDSVDGTDPGRQLAALLLTTGQASTAFDGGQAMKKAISCNNLGFLQLLVKYNQLDKSEFCSCLVEAIGLPSGHGRLEKTRLLLTTGADISGDVGTTAMRHEMEGLRDRGEVTLRMLRLLLEAGANVSHNQGEIIGDAMAMRLFECFKLFLGYHPSVQARKACFEVPLAHALNTSDLRYIQELLEIGVPQSLIDQALIRSCAETGNDSLVLLLLKSHASVNYQEGAAICKAIARKDLPLLSPLLRHSPSGETLAHGFSLSLTIADIKVRFQFLRLLLDAGKIPSQLLNDTLVSAAAGGQEMADICKLLLLNQASPSYANGTPLCSVLQSPAYDIRLLQVLLSFNPSTDAIAAALKCGFDTLHNERRLSAIESLLGTAKPQSMLDWLLSKTVGFDRHDIQKGRANMSETQVQEARCDYELLKLLLQANASVLYQEAECIYYAVMKNDLTALSILRPFFKGQSSVGSQVFQRAWENGARAGSQQATLSLLLKSGAAGDCINIALVETIRTSASSPNRFSFILDLLSAGADVNYDHGASLMEACSQGDLRVLQELFAHSPLRSSTTSAFPLIFRSGVGSKTLQKLIVLCCSHAACPIPIVKTSHLRPILFLLLESYPKEKHLLEYLIDAGYPVDPIIHNDTEDESLLCWALAQDKRTIPEDIIDVLLGAGGESSFILRRFGCNFLTLNSANPHYQTAHSFCTPLEIAISTSRSDSVATLLRLGADPLIETSAQLSLLSLAALSGSRETVMLLSEVGAGVNDGVLHQAAQEVNLDVLQLLLKEGNQRDAPSSKFNGRTALAELCLSAHNQPASQVKKAMLLLKEKGDFKRLSGRKSILHFALDNPDAVSMTQLLLDTFMGQCINDQFNLYEENGLIYSPVAYVRKGRNGAPQRQQEALVKLLEGFGCKDRYWATRGDQPTDAVGVPEEIAQIIKDEENHDRQMKWRRAEHAEVRTHTLEQHNLTLQNQRAAARETATIENETADRHARITSKRYSAEAAQFRVLTDLANRRKDDENGREITHRREIGQLEHSEREKTIASDHKRRQMEIEHVERQQKVLTAAYEQRARIRQKDREANAREQRRLQERSYEFGSDDSLD